MKEKTYEEIKKELISSLSPREIEYYKKIVKKSENDEKTKAKNNTVEWEVIKNA